MPDLLPTGALCESRAEECRSPVLPPDTQDVPSRPIEVNTKKSLDVPTESIGVLAPSPTVEPGPNFAGRHDFPVEHHVSSEHETYTDRSVARTTPSALGYLRRDLLGTDDEFDRAKTALAAFAQRAGLRLSGVFVEQLDHGDLDGFRHLVDSALDGQTAAVVVPNLLHFMGLGHAGTFAAAFEHLTGARVLTVVSS